MKKRLPTIAESAEELQQRFKAEQNLKKRQRLQALYLLTSRQARTRQAVAALLGVHRHESWGRGWRRTRQAGWNGC